MRIHELSALFSRPKSASSRLTALRAEAGCPSALPYLSSTCPRSFAGSITSRTRRFSSADSGKWPSSAREKMVCSPHLRPCPGDSEYSLQRIRLRATSATVPLKVVKALRHPGPRHRPLRYGASFGGGVHHALRSSHCTASSIRWRCVDARCPSHPLHVDEGAWSRVR